MSKSVGGMSDYHGCLMLVHCRRGLVAEDVYHNCTNLKSHDTFSSSVLLRWILHTTLLHLWALVSSYDLWISRKFWVWLAFITILQVGYHPDRYPSFLDWHDRFSDLQPPRSDQDVYREDCTQCFDSIVRLSRALHSMLDIDNDLGQWCRSRRVPPLF